MLRFHSFRTRSNRLRPASFLLSYLQENQAKSHKQESGRCPTNRSAQQQSPDEQHPTQNTHLSLSILLGFPPSPHQIRQPCLVEQRACASELTAIHVDPQPGWFGCISNLVVCPRPCSELARSTPSTVIASMPFSSLAIQPFAFRYHR